MSSFGDIVKINLLIRIAQNIVRMADIGILNLNGRRVSPLSEMLKAITPITMIAHTAII